MSGIIGESKSRGYGIIKKDSAALEDNSITLAKMAGGTDGQIITYDASGDPVAVGPGTDGQVLTSTGAGSPPAFEDNVSVDLDSNEPYYVSAFTDNVDDSGLQTVNTTFGFGTVVSVSIANGIRIRMHIMGGMVNYDAGGLNFGTCVNHKITSTFSGSTDGNFESLNWCNEATRITGVYCLADYSNSSGGTVTVYFRAALKSSASSASCRWYTASGTGIIRKWYELINI